MVEPRYQIFRLLDERQNTGTAGIPTIGDIAEGLGMPLTKVALVLKSSEAMGMVAIHRYMGATEKDSTVFLQPPTYIYLESKRPNGESDL